MRELVLDTETTGLDPAQGDRLIEIGAIELVNTMPTGRTYHVYINPERPVSEGAFRVHGISDEFLADKPKFADVVDEFLEFAGDAGFVIHNAEFDMRFLNSELARLKRPVFTPDRATCTLIMARKRYPGARASLDELCKRFEIDATNRTLHGALIDAELLSEVYLELVGGRQRGLELVDAAAVEAAARRQIDRPFRAPRAFAASVEEVAAHATFLGTLKDALWLKQQAAAEAPSTAAAAPAA